MAKVSASDQLEHLRRAGAEATAEVRTAEIEHRAAEQAVERGRAAVVAAYAERDARGAEQLAADLALLEADLAAWPARVEGARLRASRAEQEVARFAGENIARLLDERAPSGVAARDELVAALAAVTAAHRAWNVVAAEVRGLLGLAGHAGADGVPSLAPVLDDLVMRARRLDAGSIPAPAPQHETLPPALAVADVEALQSLANRRLSNGVAA